MNTLDLLKAVFAMVKLVEAAIPDASSGKQKFDEVVARIEAEAGILLSNVPVLATFITGAVNVLNLLGVFKKKPAADVAQ